MLSQPYLTLALTFPHWPSLLTNAILCSIASVPAIDSMFLFIRADSIAASAALLSAHVIYVHRVPPGQIRTLCRLLYPSPSALFSTPGIASNGVIGKLYRSRNSPGPAKLTWTWPASSQINTFSGKIQSEIWVL